MDWLTRAIDVRDIEKTCMDCPNRNLKSITTVCSQCVCKLLSDKLETERKSYLEREKKNGESR
jgi:hypothetical protein